MKKNLMTTIKNIFLLTLLFIVTISCKTKHYKSIHHTHKLITIDDKLKKNKEVESFISEYRNLIENDLSRVLAYNPQKLDKTKGKWQNKMTNFFADALLEMSNTKFKEKTGKSVDFCILNYGGIRSDIGVGDVTTRTAYQIMPFENKVTVLELTSKKIWEMANYILKNKTAHPLSGIEITIKKNKVKTIRIKGEEVKSNKTYFVVTNDYLAKGGDKMTFLFNPVTTTKINQKLRDVYMNYFTKIDTLKPSLTKRIIEI